MDWTTALPPLVGTVIGGALTIIGQRLTDKHRDDAERAAARRQVVRDDAQRDREAVTVLHRQVSGDVAEVRKAISATNDEVNQRRAERLAPLIDDIRERADRAACLIAEVPDEGVRDAADKVYDSFGLWISQEVEALDNGTANPSADDLRAAPGKLAAAVRSFLQQSQTQERSAVSNKT